MRVLRYLSGRWGVLPASYTLEGEIEIPETRAWTFGGFSEVWCGTLGDKKVAIKVIKIAIATNPKKMKEVRVVTQP